MQGNCRQPVVQIFAKTSRANIGLKITIRRGDHPNINDYGAIAAERTKLTFLQNPQQLGLKCRAGFADFIKEQGAAICLLEQTNPILNSPGESPPFVAEQLGFKQGIGQRSAVLGNKRLVGAPTFIVNRPRHHLFTGTRFAGHHHRKVIGRNPLNQITNPVHRAARGANQAVEPQGMTRFLELALDFFLQHRLGGAQIQRQTLIFELQTPHLGGVLQRQ